MADARFGGGVGIGCVVEPSSFLDEATKAVTALGGHVLKRLGDGLMALFGYPQAQENDAERAVRAALAIQRGLTESLAGRFEIVSLPTIEGNLGASIDEGALERVLCAAHCAPSVGMSQPWDFVVIDSIEQRRTVKELFERENASAAGAIATSA